MPPRVPGALELQVLPGPGRGHQAGAFQTAFEAYKTAFSHLISARFITKHHCFSRFFNVCSMFFISFFLHFSTTCHF